MTEVDESGLVAACLAGDEVAAERLVATFQSMVFGIGMKLTGRAEDAEDLAQEVFLKVFRSLASYRGSSSLRSWIAAITVNTSRNRIGRIVKFRQTFADTGGGGEEEDQMEKMPETGRPDPEARVLASERKRALDEEVGRLPVEFREAVVLRDQQGLSYEEVAATLGVPVGTVRSRLARGRAILADRLKARFGSALGGFT